MKEEERVREGEEGRDAAGEARVIGQSLTWLWGSRGSGNQDVAAVGTFPPEAEPMAVDLGPLPSCCTDYGRWRKAVSLWSPQLTCDRKRGISWSFNHTQLRVVGYLNQNRSCNLWMETGKNSWNLTISLDFKQAAQNGPWHCHHPTLVAYDAWHLNNCSIEYSPLHIEPKYNILTGFEALKLMNLSL